MNLRALIQLFSPRDLRNAALAIIVVFGGLGLSGLTLYAHQTGNIRLAGVSAAASLFFVILILIFVVPPLARNAGREASQMNLPFEFTTGGAIMLVLILIVGFSAWNTGNNLLFLVLSFLIGAMIVGFFAGSMCLKRLDVSMRFPETIFAGESTPILLALTNRKRLFPAYSVVVEVRGKSRDRSVASAELHEILPAWIARRVGRAPIVRRTLCHVIRVAARTTEDARTDIVFPTRGRLLISDFELSTKFPFGFFRHRRRLPAREADIIVFPALTDVELDQLGLAAELGKKITHRRGRGHDLLTMRNYQPQDDLRLIDWKATARTRQLMVREFADEEEILASVIFDTRLPSSTLDPKKVREKLSAEHEGRPVVVSERFERGASIAASLTARLSKITDSSTLVLGSEPDEVTADVSSLIDSLRRLALAEPIITNENFSEPRFDLERILNGPDDRYYFLVTAGDASGLPPELKHRLKIIDY